MRGAEKELFFKWVFWGRASGCRKGVMRFTQLLLRESPLSLVL